MKPTERLCARNNIPVRYAVGGLCEEVVRMAISLGVQTIRLTDVATKEALVKVWRNELKKYKTHHRIGKECRVCVDGISFLPINKQCLFLRQQRHR